MSQSLQTICPFPLEPGEMLLGDFNGGNTIRALKHFTSTKEADDFANEYGGRILKTRIDSSWGGVVQLEVEIEFPTQPVYMTNRPGWTSRRRPEFATSEELEMDMSEATTLEMMRILEMRKASLEFIDNLEREGWLPEDSSYKEEMRHVWDQIWNGYFSILREEHPAVDVAGDFVDTSRAVTDSTWQTTMGATVSTSMIGSMWQADQFKENNMQRMQNNAVEEMKKSVFEQALENTKKNKEKK